MADSNFIVKNTLVVNTGFTANSTLVNAAAINVTNQVNTAAINVTNQVNTTTLYAATSANVGTAVVANSSGLYTTGTVNATSYNTGSGGGSATGGITVNTSVITIGNNTVNVSTNSTHFYAGNSTYYGFGNSTADVLVSPTGNIVLTPTSLTLSNASATVLTANVTQLTITTPVSANGSVGTAGQVFTSNGSSGAPYWANASVSSNNLVIRQQYTANGSQNTFTVTGGYTNNNLDVYLNGVKLLNSVEVNVASGSTFTILTGNPANGSNIEVVGGYANFSGTLPVTAGGTGVTVTGSNGYVLTSNGSAWYSAAIPAANLASGVTNVLPPANGGTGLSSPGSNGNLLTSNGSAWVSSAPSPSSTANIQTFSTSGT